MLGTVRDTCQIHSMVHDYRMTDAIENLSNLIDDERDGREFFARYYVTQGMETLFHECLLRLAGRSDQAAFELTQAMGGGKTHLMVALGLVANHPPLRSTVLPHDLVERLDFGAARIAAFTGRNDPEHYIWGEIGTQLGKADLVRPYWIEGPRGIDEKKWLEIIGDEPTLILLDELPPYLLNADTRSVGKGSLADLVSLYDQRPADRGHQAAALLCGRRQPVGQLRGPDQGLGADHVQPAAGVPAPGPDHYPVQLAGNEIYEILKKRLFTELPGDSLIDSVAEAFAGEVKAAKDGGYITARAMEEVAEEAREHGPVKVAVLKRAEAKRRGIRWRVRTGEAVEGVDVHNDLGNGLGFRAMWADVGERTPPQQRQRERAAGGTRRRRQPRRGGADGRRCARRWRYW